MIKKILFIILTSMSMLTSCEDSSQNTVPFSRVNFEVHLSGIDYVLNNLYHYRIYEQGNYGTGKYVGYAGLLIVCVDYEAESGIPVLKAYDLCCPYEGRMDIRIVPDLEGKATCPNCKSVYMLDYGFPHSGPSQKKLQEYSCIPQTPYSGIYHIYN